MKRIVLAATLLTATATPACYGSYAAFTKVHHWNGHATDSKVANSAIHLAFWIVPVYPVLLFVDFLVLNNIEFITGSNPLQ